MASYKILDAVDMKNKKFPICFGEEIYIRVYTYQFPDGSKIFVASFPNYVEDFTVDSPCEDFTGVASFTEHAFGECLIDIYSRTFVKEDEEEQE